MIELISILAQFIIFLVIFSFPFNPKNLNKILKLSNNPLNYIDCHALNIIFILNALLIMSFFSIDLRVIFTILFLISLTLIIYRLKEIQSLISTKNILEFIFFAIIIISIFISTAEMLKIEWDGHHWITKALVFFHNKNIHHLQESNMPEYPHLGGYVWAFFWKNSILELEYFGRYFYIYFYIVSIFTIFNVLNFKSEKLSYILIFALIFLSYDPYLFSGYQDYLIFSTLAISARFIALIDFDKIIDYKKIIIILLTMHLLMWFKDEGLFYFLIFGTLLIFLSKSSIRTKFLLFVLILSIGYLQSLLQKKIIGIYGFNTEIISKKIIDQLLNIKLLILKTIAISKHIVIAFLKYPLWILIILSFLFVNNFNKENSSLIKYFFYAFILNIFLIYAVYLHDPNQYEFVLSVTLDRLMFQTSGFYILVFILLLNKSKLKNINL